MVSATVVGDAEIDDLHLAAGGHQHVGRLDVAVHQTPGRLPSVIDGEAKAAYDGRRLSTSMNRLDVSRMSIRTFGPSTNSISTAMLVSSLCSVRTLTMFS